MSAAARGSSYASTIAARSMAGESSTCRTLPLTSSAISALAARRCRSRPWFPASRPIARPYNSRVFLAGSALRFFLIVLAFCSAAHAAAPQPPSIIGRSWIIGDLSSGQILAAQKADERIEPASLTKLMTAYVVFQALRDKKLTLEQQVNVSERAARAP